MLMLIHFFNAIFKVNSINKLTENVYQKNILYLA
jgi:hypothetical protein